jgi:hypothetical protein
MRGEILLWDLERGKLSQRLMPVDAWDLRAASIAFSPDSKMLAIGVPQQVCVCDVLSGNVLARLSGADGRCQYIKFLDEDRIAAVWGGSVKIQSMKRKAIVQEREIEVYDEKGGRGSPTAVAISSDGKRVAIATIAGVISEWDIKTKSPIMDWTQAHGDNQIMALLYVPSTYTWVSCDVSGGVILWNPVSPLTTLTAPVPKTPSDKILELEEAVRQRTNWASGHDELARAYWAQGDVVNMFRHFHAAAQADPSSNQPHKYLKEVYDGIARYEDYRREDEADKNTDLGVPGGTVLVPELRAEIQKKAMERRSELESVIRELQS